MITLQEMMNDSFSDKELLQRNTSTKIRVAVPGIIQSFNADEQTVTVQPAVRELINVNGEQRWLSLPLLLDVPIVFPRAGGFVITMPINTGDECLVVFADSCIDAWWQSGDVQNQVEIRRHDLSDAFAILGCWSQPNVVSGYNTGALQIRSLDGGSAITITSGSIDLSAGSITINGSTTIEGVSWMGHKHSGVESGGANTGGIV